MQNDPNFNLRREPAFIFRNQSNEGVSFASVIEPHGEYNPTVEYTLASHSNVKSVSQFSMGSAELIVIESKAGHLVSLGIAKDSDDATTHSVTANGEEFTWAGPYKLFHSEQNTDGAQ